MLGKNFYKISLVFKKLNSFRRFSSAPVEENFDWVNAGDKLSVYSFLLAGDMVKDVIVKEFDVCLEISRGSLISALTIFKYSSLMKFDFLVDMVSWDKPGERFRFTILYSFLSTSWNSRFYILCQTREGVPLESVIDLYEASSWLERECWDMHGIYFVNHNNFLRLLTDYGFRGHPLRKDFPLSGFVELFYDDSASGVVYEPVELVQEYRNFQFKSPWAEGMEVSSEAREEDLEDFDFDFDFEDQKLDDDNSKSGN